MINLPHDIQEIYNNGVLGTKTQRDKMKARVRRIIRINK